MIVFIFTSTTIKYLSLETFGSLFQISARQKGRYLGRRGSSRHLRQRSNPPRSTYILSMNTINTRPRGPETVGQVSGWLPLYVSFSESKAEEGLNELTDIFAKFPKSNCLLRKACDFSTDAKTVQLCHKDFKYLLIRFNELSVI